MPEHRATTDGGRSARRSRRAATPVAATSIGTVSLPAGPLSLTLQLPGPGPAPVWWQRGRLLPVTAAGSAVPGRGRHRGSRHAAGATAWARHGLS